MTDLSLGDAARILKVSPRRLRYWQQTRLLDSLGQASFEGVAFRDLVCLRTIVTLLDKGIPLQRIRRNLEMLRERLPEMDEPASALRLWDEVSRHVVVRRDGRLEEAGGQLLLEFEGEGVAGAARVSSLAEAKAGHATAADHRDEALDWFERGCELDTDARHWAEAVQAYEEATRLDPDFADAYCNLGAVLYNQGDRDAARRAFETCLACETDHVEANFNLANVLEEEGQDDRALLHYRRALEGDPLYADLHINLALIYEKLGRDGPARRHWRRYLDLDPGGSWAEVARLRVERRSG